MCVCVSVHECVTGSTSGSALPCLLYCFFYTTYFIFCKKLFSCNNNLSLFLVIKRVPMKMSFILFISLGMYRDTFMKTRENVATLFHISEQNT